MRKILKKKRQLIARSSQKTIPQCSKFGIKSLNRLCFDAFALIKQVPREVKRASYFVNRSYKCLVLCCFFFNTKLLFYILF